MGSSASTSGAPRTRAVSLSEACADLLLLALEIQKSDVDIRDGQDLRERTKAKLTEFAETVEGLGLPRGDIDDARYALVATIDEVLQFSGWASKLGWEINPLQAELFNERNAGMAFFTRLENVRQRGSQVLEVFYLCLAVGFRGRYRISSEDELTRLLDQLSREIGREEAPLSPKATLTGEPAKAPRSFPWIATAAAALVGSLLLAGVLYFLLGAASDDAVSVIRVFGG